MFRASHSVQTWEAVPSQDAPGDHQVCGYVQPGGQRVLRGQRPGGLQLHPQLPQDREAPLHR